MTSEQAFTFPEPSLIKLSRSLNAVDILFADAETELMFPIISSIAAEDSVISEV